MIHLAKEFLQYAAIVFCSRLIIRPSLPCCLSHSWEGGIFFFLMLKLISTNLVIKFQKMKDNTIFIKLISINGQDSFNDFALGFIFKFQRFTLNFPWVHLVVIKHLIRILLLLSFTNLARKRTSKRHIDFFLVMLK